MAVATSTIIGAIGLGIGAAGTVTTMRGQAAAAKASNRAEDLRKKQLNLDVMRQRRQIVRESIMARSVALNNATSQGAQGGTGLQGGYGQIASQTGNNMNYTNQSASLGYQMFEANKQQTNGQTMASFGSGMQGFGGMLMNNADTIGRVGDYYRNRYAT